MCRRAWYVLAAVMCSGSLDRSELSTVNARAKLLDSEKDALRK